MTEKVKCEKCKDAGEIGYFLKMAPGKVYYKPCSDCDQYQPLDASKIAAEIVRGFGDGMISDGTCKDEHLTPDDWGKIHKDWKERTHDDRGR